MPHKLGLSLKPSRFKHSLPPPVGITISGEYVTRNSIYLVYTKVYKITSLILRIIKTNF